MYPLIVVAGLVIAIIGSAIPDEEKFNQNVKKAVKKLTGDDKPPAKSPVKPAESPPSA